MRDRATDCGGLMTFREFWPLYLQAHSHPVTRAVHYGATVIGFGSTALAAITFEPIFLLGIGLAYLIAIGAHTFIEKNQSMIRVNPAWGAVADLRMLWLAATGGLAREMEASGAARHRSAPRPMPAHSAPRDSLKV